MAQEQFLRNSDQVVGSFAIDNDVDFKAGFKRMYNNFITREGLDPIHDLSRIVASESVSESYKEDLIGDILSESFGDNYYNLLPQKLEQLFENTREEIINESFTGTLLPIVGYSLPLLKKSFLECHAKDIVMTEIPKEPIIKLAFERKFLKDKTGAKKYYIPEVFYNDDYKEVMKQAKGNPIPNTWYPKDSSTVPFQDLDILAEAGGSLQMRDTLAYDFVIEGVQIDIDGELKEITGLEVRPEKSVNNAAFAYQVKYTKDDGTVVIDHLTGAVDFYTGKVSIASTAGLIKKVRFGGHLSNQNNYNSLEIDRQRESMTWEIPDGIRFNTGFTLEKIRDMKALTNIDIMADTIADMGTVMQQYKDSVVFDFLDEQYHVWKDRKDLPFGYQRGFTETYEFSMTPNTTTIALTPQWVDQIKFYIDRMLRSLTEKLNTKDIMFVLYGNPAHVELLNQEVSWVIDHNSKIGGVQLDYRFGVLNRSGMRVHVVSSMKVPRDAGLRVVAYPTTEDHVTFKLYEYSTHISNEYRNPNTPLIPNIMGTTRFLPTKVLPVQGQMVIKDDDFGRVTAVR